MSLAQVAQVAADTDIVAAADHVSAEVDGFFQAEVARGIEDIDQGRFITNEEAKRRALHRRTALLGDKNL